MFVDAKVVGRPNAGVEPREIGFDPAGQVLLRTLIEHVVREEVAAFADRERQRRFVRVLSAEDIDRGAAAGKIGAEARSASAPVDPDGAVRTALGAFEDGLYFVFIDDTQIEDLDESVVIGPATRMRFLRLVPLAGG